MKHLVLLWFGLQLFYACQPIDRLTYQGEDIDFSSPERIVSIPALIGDYSQRTEPVLYNDSTLFVSGFVVSSDRSGNFYKELIIQDQPSNPESGLRVLINSTQLYTRYPIGRRIFIRLYGLTLDLANGIYTLGIADNSGMQGIHTKSEDYLIWRDTLEVQITPLNLNVSDLPEMEEESASAKSVNRWVSLADFQFNRNEVLSEPPMTFASESTDQFDGERLLESCLDNQQIILSTSVYSDFKSISLPEGRGEIHGILTKNFFGDAYNLVVNDPLDIEFVNAERCDPPPAFVFEDFNGFDGFDEVEDSGWRSVNLYYEELGWSLGEFDGNKYLQISGYNSDEDEIEVWLISPIVDMDQTVDESIALDIQTSFNNGAELRLWYSDDYNGEVEEANWYPLEITIPEGSESGFGEFEETVSQDLTHLVGTIHFAFSYSGSDPGATTRFHLDNWTVRGTSE
ncbi:DUF5689 domain-containing protein [Aureitalea marina]|uniref:DUF5689 domain-containing protein n=1 Tax=Aureitalea marina TaxID=930804 RepID=A0A2S7KSM2_9FLAO|nr:DUF5689 domain-containing protein [Aureitalea marina]PQB05616.1 hypothetical protein BST85_12445 [Aureitalea marina]